MDTNDFNTHYYEARDGMTPSVHLICAYSVFSHFNHKVTVYYSNVVFVIKDFSI